MNLDKILKSSFIGLMSYISTKLLNMIIRGSYFYFNGKFLSPIFQNELLNIEKKYGKFDLIVMRGHGTFELVWAYQDSRVIQTVESVFIREKKWIDKFYIKNLYKNKNIACVSSGVKKKVEEVIDTIGVNVKSIQTIYNPIDLSSITKMIEEYTPDINEPYIVSLGRITPNKNIPFLLESYKYARDIFGVKELLIIIGDGSDMQNVKLKIKELNLTKYVKLLGLLENPFPWLNNAKLFTLPSKAEGLPTVVIEALSCQTKIVATKSKGGIWDIMTDDLSDYLVDFNPQSFAKKISETLAEEKSWDFEKYIKKFSPESIIDSYIEKYIKN
jgi:glycosyltransferase involved in cell wall biosynthesis